MIKRNRNHRITLRMSDNEFAVFKEKIACSKKSQQQFFLDLLLSDETKTLNELNSVAREIAKIGVNVNQITKNINSNKIYYSDIQEIKKEMEEIWHFLKLLQAKHPLLQQ